MQCPSEGCGGGDPRLNRIKNRTDEPDHADAEEWSVPQIIDLNEATPDKWTKGKVRTELEDIAEGSVAVVLGSSDHRGTYRTIELSFRVLLDLRNL